MSSETGIEQAIRLAGGQQPLADVLGVTQQAVAHMKRRGYVPMAHRLTLVTRYGVPIRSLLSPDEQVMYDLHNDSAQDQNHSG